MTHAAAYTHTHLSATARVMRNRPVPHFCLPSKGFTSHWLRMISASIAGAVGVSIGSMARGRDKARGLLDLGDLADIDTDAT